MYKYILNDLMRYCDMYPGVYNVSLSRTSSRKAWTSVMKKYVAHAHQATLNTSQDISILPLFRIVR